MRDDQEHVLVPTLKRQLAEHAIDRREFLRFATLLGMSAGAVRVAQHRALARLRQLALEDA